MVSSQSLRPPVLIALLFLSGAGLSQQRSAGSDVSADQASLRAVVDRFFAAYTRKDLNSFIQLWSAKSPEVESRGRAMREIFGANEKIELLNLTVRDAAIDGDKARVRVIAELSAVDAKTGTPAAGFGRMNRAFHFVKEGGVWKVWGESSAVEDLVAALSAAKSDEERTTLLEGDKELMTVELRKALIAQGRSLVRADFSQARLFYQLAQAVAEKIDDQAGIVAALIGIGGAYRLQGDYRPSMDYLQKALALARESQDKSAMGDALYNIGSIHSARGDLDSAFESLQNGLTLSREAGNKTTSSLLLNSIAITYARRGQYDQALDGFQKSWKLQEELGNKNVMDAILGNIGNIYRHQGNYRLALETYEKGLRLAEEIGDKESVAQVLNNIGNVYYFQGDSTLGLEYYQKSLALKEQLGQKIGMVTALENIGNIHRERGDYGEALGYYKRSLTIIEEIQATANMPTVLADMGHAYLLQGDYPQALDCAQKCLRLSESLGDQVGAIESLGQIALIHLALKDYAKSLEAAERATGMARQIGERDELWGVLVTRGKAQRALGQTEKARQSFDEAIGTIESLRSDVAGGEQQQQSFFADKLAPYHEAVALLLAQDKTSEALTYAERARARVLLDVLRSGRVNVTKAMTTQEQARERSLKAQMVSLNALIPREEPRKQPDSANIGDLRTKLQTARIDYEAFQNSLYAAHSELKLQRGEAQTITLEEWRIFCRTRRAHWSSTWSRARRLICSS